MRAEEDTEEEEAGLCLSVLILKLPSLAYLYRKERKGGFLWAKL